MATALTQMPVSIPRQKPKHGDINKLLPCSPDGPISAAIEKGDEYRALGDFENAWTQYSVALQHWLAYQWIHWSQKNCGNMCAHDIAAKLRSAGLFDRWTNDAMKLLLQRPTPARWLHVDVAAGIAKAVCRVGG